MRCRGCGGKTSARVLQRVLHRLRTEWPAAPEEFLQSDDTALLPDRLPGQQGPHAVSVDFFPAFLTDPWLSGRIAAIHAMSDLWASGVQPTAALAMVTLPEGSLDRQSELLHQVLSGALRELSDANVVLVGGHTTNGEELAIGFTVFGKSQGAGSGGLPLRKANLRSGQMLILTKALGTGVILAASDSGLSTARSISAAIDMMLQSNQRAGEIACEYGVTAATDVTGFGLAGHLLEMCHQSCVTVELDVACVPLIKGAAEHIHAGIRSSLYAENKAAVQDFIAVPDGPGVPNNVAIQSSLDRLEAIYDPQTSGGLVLGVDADRANQVLSQLMAAGYRDATIIGRVAACSDADSSATRIIVKIAAIASFCRP